MILKKSTSNFKYFNGYCDIINSKKGFIQFKFQSNKATILYRFLQDAEKKIHNHPVLLCCDKNNIISI